MSDTIVLIKGDVPFEKTFDLYSLKKARVLSSEGLIVGRVIGIYTTLDSRNITGIMVRRGLFGLKMYIGSKYISSINKDAIILNIEPVIFLKGMSVLSDDGERIGKVSKVNRKGNTNDLESIIVKRRWCKPVEVPVSAISKIAQSILLDKGYHIDKTYFWQRSK